MTRGVQAGRNSGFTLVEVLVTLALVSLLLTIVVPRTGFLRGDPEKNLRLVAGYIEKARQDAFLYDRDNLLVIATGDVASTRLDQEAQWPFLQEKSLSRENSFSLYRKVKEKIEPHPHKRLVFWELPAGLHIKQVRLYNQDVSSGLVMIPLYHDGSSPPVLLHLVDDDSTKTAVILPYQIDVEIMEGHIAWDELYVR